MKIDERERVKRDGAGAGIMNRLLTGGAATIFTTKRARLKDDQAVQATGGMHKLHLSPVRKGSRCLVRQLRSGPITPNDARAPLFQSVPRTTSRSAHVGKPVERYEDIHA
ncbi:hypothetical protein P154DRAFT_322878 [Amniculicola lignicola CBS 123094]|uniref:Uncharacterized protein n=1 Tax=Amniculicola lignicola CBS 123094 TaxID=1392246 RepID=A0A6A5WF78_9PLEO|nr:hypothetical protein P154DRAFT_322878 [Amniculicola lignicola CBS 123094]